MSTSPLHKNQEAENGIHSTIAWKFATESDRLNHNPSEGPTSSQLQGSVELGKIAWQHDNNTYYFAKAIDGTTGSITWENIVVGPSGSVADGQASYLVLTNTGSLTNERAFTVGTGLSATDAGAGSTYTVDIDDSVVATVSGTTFTGVTKHSAGLIGS